MARIISAAAATQLLGLVLFASGCTVALRHRPLSSGGAVSVVTRWAAHDARPLPNGGVVVAATYSTLHGNDHEWMARGTAQVVGAVSPNGQLAWTLGAPGGEHGSHRIATTSEGVTWVVGRFQGPLQEARSPNRVVHFSGPPPERPTLTRVALDGTVQLTFDLAELGVNEPEALPFLIVATPDGGAMFLATTLRAFVAVRIAADGTPRFVRRIERGFERAPGTGGAEISGTLEGDTLWVAGSGTALSLAEDRHYQGPIVAALSTETGEVRHVFPLESEVTPAGWDYPTGIAVTGGAIMLARSTVERARVTAHDPSTFRELRQIYGVTGAEVEAISTDGEDHLLILARQRGAGIVAYGRVQVHTSTAVPTSTAAVAMRIPSGGGTPEVLRVLKAKSPKGLEVGSTLVATAIFPVGRTAAIVGTFWGVLSMGVDEQVRGTYGTENRCTHEDFFAASGCDRIPWSAASTFLIVGPPRP